MRTPSRTGLSCALLCITAHVTAQDLEAIGRESPVAFSGALSINQILHTSRNAVARREPYNFFMSANANLALYGWSIPVSFSLTRRASSLTQPFNQYAVHPKWKWITLHAGYTSASFSPYTVNGHVFRGTRIDIEPGEKWRIGVLAGRFLKAVAPQSATTTRAAFRRLGYGVKLGYGSKDDAIEIILFKASDDPHSIPKPADSLRLLPQENVAMSIATSKTVLKHFVIRAEIAQSGVTRDVRAAKTESSHAPIFSPLLNERESTIYHRAIKSSLSYQDSDWSLGVGYECVDPGYQTFGAYYFNSDLENATIDLTARLAGDAIRFSGSGGIQRDNIDGTKISTMRRFVSASNVSWVPSQKFNISGSWSSFQTYTNIRSPFNATNPVSPYEHVDTLNYHQINRTASFSGIYSISPGNNITIHASWQGSIDAQGDPEGRSRSAFSTLNAGYTLTLPQHNTGISLSLTASRADMPINSFIVGPALSVMQSLLEKKLRTTAFVSWNRTQNDDMNSSSLLSARLNATLVAFTQHTISLGAIMVRRDSGTRPATLEFTTTFSYQYSFSRPNSNR